MPLALRVVGRSEYFASGSGKHFWRSLSAVLMDAAPVLATQKRSDRPLEDPGGPCRAWIESDVKGGVQQEKMNKGPHKSGHSCPTSRSRELRTLCPSCPATRGACPCRLRSRGEKACNTVHPLIMHFVGSYSPPHARRSFPQSSPQRVHTLAGLGHADDKWPVSQQRLYSREVSSRGYQQSTPRRCARSRAGAHASEASGVAARAVAACSASAIRGS